MRMLAMAAVWGKNYFAYFTGSQVEKIGVAPVSFGCASGMPPLYIFRCEHKQSFLEFLSVMKLSVAVLLRRPDDALHVAVLAKISGVVKTATSALLIRCGFFIVRDDCAFVSPLDHACVMPQKIKSEILGGLTVTTKTNRKTVLRLDSDKTLDCTLRRDPASIFSSLDCFKRRFNDLCGGLIASQTFQLTEKSRSFGSETVHQVWQGFALHADKVFQVR